ncbi:MAG: trypsin-like peptidase domain-containing protein [Phycisphaeraceae bacterium]|nr:trypsin-like peptidase domain-containing protein [Phycisphaeraceae bacterium]
MRITPRCSPLFALLALAGLILVSPSIHAQLLPKPDLRNSVVKIHTTAKLPSVFQPWRKQAPREGSGTGMIIAGNKILTNAHVVAYATQVYVQPYQSADRIEAKVVAYAPGVDLALIELPEKEQGFFEDRPALAFAEELPAIRGDVSVYGYPLGGEDLSVTKGIVSRIEVASYKHGFIGLRVQVDAALNPGNSGGPALIDDKVVGLVFSGMRQADNIGYLIPVKEIKDFLNDAEDGSYDGRPEVTLGAMQTLENDALREMLKLDDDVTGMLVSRVFENTDSPLKPWDVVTHIGEHDIDNIGNCKIRDDLRGAFTYFVHQVVDEEGGVPLTVYREGKSIKVNAKARLDAPTLLPSLAKHNDHPRYYIVGPLVFTQATTELVGSLPPQYITVFNFLGNPLVTRATEEPSFDGEELIVVAAPMFDHRIAKSYDRSHLSVLGKINGIKIKNLRHLATVINELEDEFVTIEFDQRIGEKLVFKRSELIGSTEEIVTDNGIRYTTSKDLRDLAVDEE